ncbi:histidine phosphatase family protein [Rossellomorea vietnamensis]|uniref:Histidine phosphatase family protein n=1 Tax=Rossellomorea vietnamensis TaxID=218284 RepID=A0A5D4NW98_9BACI|nr:histidine phosphatase family protein [Rossellomorea vietnamensis]TYS18623.1 histidine phosphatase family protein [Rossellomorea vietnamensis]
MVTAIYFVRHAHSVYTPDELGRPLSEKGMEDTEKITEILAEEDIDVFLSSPYLRAAQTIEGAAEQYKKEIIHREGFKERTLSEVPASDFASAISRVWEDWTFSWEGGESNQEAQARGVDSLYKVLAEFKEKKVVIGTHGNIMVLIMNYFDKKYDFNFWKTLDMPDIYKLTFTGKHFIDCQRVM